MKLKKARLEVLRLPVGQFNANCYLVYDYYSREALVVDPGDSADFILTKIIEFDLNPRGIIATHGHFDHLGAASEIVLSYPVPFMIHKKDEFLLMRLRRTSIHFTKIDPGPEPQVDRFIKGGDSVSVGNSNLKVIETPGHTPGSIVLYCREQKIIFSGDLIFINGEVGRSDHSYSSPSTLQASIQKITKLPDKTIVYPGHNGEFSIEDFIKSYTKN